MQDAKAGIEPESSDSKPRLGFKQCIKAIEHRVNRIRSESG